MVKKNKKNNNHYSYKKIVKEKRDKFVKTTNAKLSSYPYGRVYLYDINGILLYSAMITKIEIKDNSNTLFLYSNLFSKKDIIIGVLNTKYLKLLGCKEKKEMKLNVYSIYLQQTKS